VVRHQRLSHGDELRFARARCVYYEGPAAAPASDGTEQ